MLDSTSFDYNSFMLGVLLIIVLVFPFLFFDFSKKQTKKKLVIYCIISWVLLYLLASYYSNINFYYTLSDFWQLWIYIDETMKPNKISRPLIFSMHHEIKFYSIIWMMTFWWLYSYFYYFVLLYIYNLRIVNKIRLWKK